ncbi:hypothetical protein FS749_006369 [Ceratobasidium sp. UAMH 11750]|nr:hypothetical protein FS749_006369 [Ceratobasidium sp. UAMH 11750]
MFSNATSLAATESQLNDPFFLAPFELDALAESKSPNNVSRTSMPRTITHTPAKVLLDLPVTDLSPTSSNHTLVPAQPSQPQSDTAEVLSCEEAIDVPANPSANSNQDEVIWTEILDSLDGQRLLQPNQIDNEMLLVPNLALPWCSGIPLTFPSGCSPYTSYPFQLHDRRTVPWSIRIEPEGTMHLVSSVCQTTIDIPGHKACSSCEEITNHPVLEGIVRRANQGTHENTPRQYLSVTMLLELLGQKTSQIDTMRVQNLAQARKIATLVRNLDDYKRLTMAIGSGRVERVNALVSVALRNGSAVRGIIDLYERAASGLYKPHGYTQEEMLRTFLLLKLGGTRVADVAHRSMSSPSISTTRKYAPVAALRASPSTPTLDEVMYNIDLACACLVPSRPESSDSEGPVEGYVGQLDEIKIQALFRWDPDTNTILGACREHVQDPTCLQFKSVDQVLGLFDKVNKGEVHLGTEATVAAIGFLSNDPRRSSARPVMFSSTCKREKADAHAKLINTFATACRQRIDVHGTARLYCIASDGELRRGAALVEIAMKSHLSPSSSIYPLLSPLPLMNHLVGPDDLTCDKDAKHVFKRLRNTLLRESGITVFGTQITPSLIRLHLIRSGVPPTRVNFLLDPNDKQDVPLALSLLRTIWQLPSPSVEDLPPFAKVRHGLNVLGIFFRLLVLPYTDVKLDLGEQLKYLSAAAHLCLVLFRDNAAQAHFLPIPLYVDIAIMIKNVFYCVAKTKIDNPNGNFWLVLLGTDRLETCFGLLRTMVGSDSNADMLQLGSRLSNVNICANILAEHPEWGGVARRLKLPPMESEPGVDVSAAFDHITPQAWKGNVKVSSVVLSTAWQLGREILQSLLPGHTVEKWIQDLDKSLGVDILCPFGQLLVKSPQLYASNEEQGTVGQPVAIRPTLEVTYQDDTNQELDIEDMVAISRAEGSSNCAAPYVLGPRGIKIHKAHLLRDAAMYTTLRDSKDRLGRIAGHTRYKAPSDTGITSNLVTHGSLFGRPQLLLNDPAATIVRCQNYVFLALVQITSIKHGNRLLGKVSTDMLQEEGVNIGFQILELVSIREPTPELASEQLDWSWSGKYLSTAHKCSGRFVQPLDPILSTEIPNQPTFVFRSSELQSIAGSLYAQLEAGEKHHLPAVQRSTSFPYSILGKACFVCNSGTGDTLQEDLQNASCCAFCSVPLGLKHLQHVLEHFGGHILFDPAVKRSDEPCGLCLRSTSVNQQCVVYILPKKKGSKSSHRQIDMKRSHGCPNLQKFSYKSAAEYKPNSPCTNVPISCPRCPDDAPCVWKYNLEAHLKRVHPHTPTIDMHAQLFNLSKEEHDSMQKRWDKRIAQSKRKKKAQPNSLAAIPISEKYSSVHKLRTVDLEYIVHEHKSDGLEDSSSSVSDSSSQYEDDHDDPPSDEENEGETNTSVADPGIRVQSNQPAYEQQEVLFISDEQRSRYGRVRRKREFLDELSSCVCGVKVVPQSLGVLECRFTDCETKWFHLGCFNLTSPPKEWDCGNHVGRAAKRKKAA